MLCKRSQALSETSLMCMRIYCNNPEWWVYHPGKTAVSDTCLARTVLLVCDVLILKCTWVSHGANGTVKAKTLLRLHESKTHALQRFLCSTKTVTLDMFYWSTSANTCLLHSCCTACFPQLSVPDIIAADHVLHHLLQAGPGHSMVLTGCKAVHLFYLRSVLDLAKRRIS